MNVLVRMSTVFQRPWLHENSYFISNTCNVTLKISKAFHVDIVNGKNGSSVKLETDFIFTIYFKKFGKILLIEEINL